MNHSLSPSHLYMLDQVYRVCVRARAHAVHVSVAPTASTCSIRCIFCLSFISFSPQECDALCYGVHSERCATKALFSIATGRGLDPSAAAPRPRPPPAAAATAAAILAVLAAALRLARVAPA
jgi:hypothetical protein